MNGAEGHASPAFKSVFAAKRKLTGSKAGSNRSKITQLRHSWINVFTAQIDY
jgi:hypothetical protein